MHRCELRIIICPIFDLSTALTTRNQHFSAYVLQLGADPPPYYRGVQVRSYVQLTVRQTLYIGLKAIHVNGAVFFAFLQVSWGNRRFLPVCLWQDPLFQLHQLGHVGWNELVFDPR